MPEQADPIERCIRVAEQAIESYSWKSVPEKVTIAILEELRDALMERDGRVSCQITETLREWRRKGDRTS